MGLGMPINCQYCTFLHSAWTSERAVQHRVVSLQSHCPDNDSWLSATTASPKHQPK